MRIDVFYVDISVWKWYTDQHILSIKVVEPEENRSNRGWGVAGALASLPTNHVNVHLMILMLMAAAILGDAANYTIGRFFGERLFRNPNSKIFKQSYLEKTHHFYEVLLTFWIP